jgi:hypothetical protein
MQSVFFTDVSRCGCSVILLIGSGWSFIKPFLNERDKRIIMIVLPLQVVVNTAMVVVEETPPGTMGWLTWRDILHLFDIICCCAILFPIVWSIRWFPALDPIPDSPIAKPSTLSPKPSALTPQP